MNRLRSYRAIEGMSQEELGEQLGLSPSMISGIEANRRSLPVSLSLLGYSDDRLEAPEMSAPLHRHRASTKAASKKRAKEILRLGGEVFSELCDLTPKAPAMTLQKLPEPASIEDVEDLAIEARFLLEHEEEGPIKNLTVAVEKAGVCIVPIRDVEGIDGLSAWVGNTPVIGVSPSVPGDRFRFTLAHELAHLLMHKRSAADCEQQANRFAGALLFPHDEFDAALPEKPQLRDFIALKSAWGVAVAALVYRAHELEYIDDHRYRQLQIQMSKWRRQEPATFEPAHGQLMTTLVDVNGGVDAVASELGVNRNHLFETINWRHLHVA